VAETLDLPQIPALVGGAPECRAARARAGDAPRIQYSKPPTTFYGSAVGGLDGVQAGVMK
jgi:hypothetical protein